MAGPHIHVPYERIAANLNLLSTNRPNLEIYFDAGVLDAIDIRSVDSLIKTLEYTPTLSLHAPFMDLCPGAVDTKVREATLSRFNQMLRLAQVVKPECIVFHSGYEKWKYGLATNLWLQKSLETWRPLNEKAKSIGSKIAIENIFEDSPENLKELMKEMDSDNFGICFDTGHCNLFSKVPLTDWTDSLGPYIVELHLHDNDRSADQHLPIGDGSFDFRSLFSSIKSNMTVIHTIEAHSPEHVLKSISRLDELRTIS